MLKWILGVLIVLGVVGGGGAVLVMSTGVLDQIRESVNQEPPAREVMIEDVQRGDLIRTVNAPGAIEPKQSVDVGAQVSARIIALPVEELDVVQEGDVLVRLDAESVEARLEAARSRLESAKARLVGVEASMKLAEIDLGRQKELFETGDVAKSVYESAQAAYDQAKSSVEVTKGDIRANEAQITELEKDLANTVIEATMTGVVTRVNNEVGEMVLGTANNIGTTIMSIADLEHMILRARIDEANVALVKEGQPATVYVLAHGEREFKGVVERVRLYREFYRDGTAYVEAEILIEKPEGEVLGIGWNANADIEVQTQFDVIKVPSQAVMDQRVEEIPDGVPTDHIDTAKTFCRIVYRNVDGKAVMTPVRIGSSDLTHTVILAGLSDGDQIVAGPFRALMDLKHDDPIRQQGEGDAEADAGEEDAGAGEDEAGSGDEDAGDADEQTVEQSGDGP